MKHLDYQQRYTDEVIAKTLKMLNSGQRRRKVVFKATTGSGKTVMTASAMAGIADALRCDRSNRYSEAAYIWFAPGSLHMQSYDKLRAMFGERRELRPVLFDDVDPSEGILPGEILFVNWESVNKETNLRARNDELGASIYEIVRRTRERGVPIVAVIDEEHLYASGTAHTQSEAVLRRIDPDVELRVSATPKTPAPDEMVNVPRHEVVAAGMIKRQLILNADLDTDITPGLSLDEHMMKKALSRRQAIAEAYRKEGAKVNPLLLIQLPNDSASMNADDREVREFVESYLRKYADITVDNGRLAIWLSNEKTDNLKDISLNDSPVDVLLFKEAIAKGWDCPRASVLVIFRKLQSTEFKIQTLGRIMRMPEQRHYGNELTDLGWVYTDLAKDQISIAVDDRDYVNNEAIRACRRPELNNVTLPSVYSDNTGIRYRIGPDFKALFYECCEQQWDVKRDEAGLLSTEDRRRILDTNVEAIETGVAVNVQLTDEERRINLANEQIAHYARTDKEIDRAFITRIGEYLGAFESKNNAPDKVASVLLEALSDFFALTDIGAKKAFLSPANTAMFDRLMRLAIERYRKRIEERSAASSARRVTATTWTVPEERYYNADTNEEADSELHALEPFVRLKSVKAPEREFAEYLERNREHIDWWYKNGDSGREHYAVEYVQSDGSHHPFYVDFVIRLRGGRILLFDTKTQGSEAETAPLKHNGLRRYLESERARGRDMEGGVIVRQGENWLWCKGDIANTTDLDEWTRLDLRAESASNEPN